MRKRILPIVASLMLCVMLFSACGSVFTTEQTQESALDAVAPFTQGVAGSVSNGTILDWVYETLPGSGLPATSAYKTMSSVTSTTFQATKGSTTNTFYSLPASNTTYLSLSGCKNPAQNSNQYYRLDYASSATYPGSLNTSTNKGSGVAYLATQTAGVAVRFCTDATMVAIQAVMQNCNTNFKHMAFKGVYGFDVYIGTGTERTWVTSAAGEMISTGADDSSFAHYLNLPSGYKEVLICFPQYGGVKSVNIGLPGAASIAKPLARSAKDVCFYGTSITQGACSNRAGTSYTNTLGRALDVNVRNLGFSGSGKGEPVMAEYIAKSVAAGEFSAVVLDFERNGSLQELVDWHYNFYKTIREASATIPIILVTRPIFTDTPTTNALSFHSVVLNTYQRAVASGDTHVYMFNGYEYFTPGMADLYTVDDTHPNDLGHYFMANKLYPYLYNVLYGDPDNIPAPGLGDYAGYNGSYYAHPSGTFLEGAKVADATWHAGFVHSTKQSSTNYDATTNAYILKTGDAVKSLYSYTDMMYFPKAGTKVWYHIPATTYATTGTDHKNDGSGSVALVAFYDSNGAFINGKSIAGKGSSDMVLLYDSDGDVYFWETQRKDNATDTATTGRWVCYITQTDNERIRFSFNLYNQASSPTIYYCEPDGPTFYPTNTNTTKVKLDVTWNMDKYMQWTLGYVDHVQLPLVASDIITIEKAGTTIVWWDDNMPDPSQYGNGTTITYCDAFRALGGGIVGIAAFKEDGTYDPDTLRVAANNQLVYNQWPVVAGGTQLYADSIDGTMRCYAYTTTKDNERIRISYYAGWDHVVDTTTKTDSDTTYRVRPYDVYLYVPNN